ncbi:MAG: GGDEF domain-containing protein [Acidobacteriota bacterium]
MIEVTPIITTFTVLVALAAAGYMLVSALLSDMPRGQLAALWFAAFGFGALLAFFARELVMGVMRSVRRRAAQGSTRDDLRELSDEIATLNEASTLYYLLTERLAAVVGWERAVLFVLDEEKNRYVCRRSSGEGLARDVDGVVFKRSDQFFQGFFEERKGAQGATVPLRDAVKPGNTRNTETLRRVDSAYGLKHLLPLVNRNRLIGFVLSSSSTLVAHGDEELLRAVVSHGAAALDALLLLEAEALDPHTGFMRFSFFESRLGEEMRRSRRTGNPFSVLQIDIDGLKQVNDQWGDEAGNEVIQSIASALRAKLRKSDVACRSAGEEFIVMLPDTSSEKAMIVAENLRAHVESMQVKIEESHAEVQRTISVGIAEHMPEEPTFGDELLQRAQKALLRAKNRGKNTVVIYTPTMPL